MEVEDGIEVEIIRIVQHCKQNTVNPPCLIVSRDFVTFAALTAEDH